MAARVVSLPLSSACWAAFRAGSLACLQVRPSRRSASGWVVVGFFRSPAAAASFAAWSARQLRFSVVVRRAAVGWSVSVPWAAPPFPGGAAGLPPAGLWLSVVGAPAPVFARRLASFVSVAVGGVAL